MNYFELFDIPVSLQIDKNILTGKYVELQRKYHPDFYTQSTEFEQAEALELSSQVNKAYKTFKQPDDTIKYVLQLKGLLEDDEKYQLPPTFLMEVMELNEELNAGSRRQVQELEEAIYTPVKNLIENYTEGVTTTADLLKVKEYYYKKKYLQRILDRLDD
ncbi:MAG: Fe-S protein assembly co-chaperone HscB [Bacteroidetes bacterium]|nr:Fe-S protein assembly co-chaperone HscB [Bacteroidota bacterium]